MSTNLMCIKCGKEKSSSGAAVGDICGEPLSAKDEHEVPFKCDGPLQTRSHISEAIAPERVPGPFPKVKSEDIRFYTGMHRPHPCYFIDSSHVLIISFDPDSMKLYVEFNKMGFYRYSNTSRVQFEELLRAESIGSHLDRCFKKAPQIHPCERAMLNGDWVPLVPKPKA